MDNLGFKTKKLDKKKSSKDSKKKKSNLFVKFFMISLVVLVVLGIVSYILIRRAGSNIEKRLQDIEDSDVGKNWQTISEEVEQEIKEGDEAMEEERGMVTDVLSDGEVAIALDLVDRKEEIGEDRARDGYEFVILDLSLKNQKYEDMVLYSSKFILRDKIYTEYRTVVLEEEGINLMGETQDIKARETLEGSIIYEVKKDVGMLEFIYMGEKKLVFEIE